MVVNGSIQLAPEKTRNFNVRSLIRQIKNNLVELVAIDTEIEKLLTHFDYLLTTVKGIDILTVAKLITEIFDINRFPNANKLAKYAGVAPVTFISGMANLQMANERRNRKLNEIFSKLP